VKSLEDIKNFSKVVKREPANDAAHSLTITNKIFLMGSLFGMFATYFHFFGYSYLKAKLERLGFDYVSIDLGIQESIYIAIEGFAPAILKLATLGFIYERIEILLLILTLGILIPTFFHIIQRNESKILKSKITLFERFIYSAKPLKSLVLLIPATTVALAGAFTAMISTVIVFILMAWMIAALGMLAGNSKGGDLFSDGVCFSVNDKLNDKSYQGCREITTKDGKSLVGKKVYRNNEYIYFITNTGAYELTSDLSVSMYIPYVKKDLVTSSE
jgi:hypothetical protein